MTPDVFICDAGEAAALCHQYDSVLSVLSVLRYDFKHPDHLHVEFDDTVNTDWGGPTLDDARTILDWAATRLDGRILVHCAAGMSRSTASAIGICTLAGMTGPDAWAHVRRSRPDLDRHFIPNPLLLRHFDELLGTDLLDLSDRKRELRWAA